MTRVLVAVDNLIHADEGQDLLEYALLTALVVIGALLAVRGVGGVMNDLWWGPIARVL